MPPPVAISPGQLALRFTLEVASLVALGVWAHGALGANEANGTSALGSSTLSLLGAIGLPLVVATAWGTFAVPGDPSRNARAPVPVRGWQRAILELLVFAAGAAALAARAHWVWFALFVTSLVAHHALTTARLRWLLEQ